jgi:hypothetical protein
MENIGVVVLMGCIVVIGGKMTKKECQFVHKTNLEIMEHIRTGELSMIPKISKEEI